MKNKKMLYLGIGALLIVVAVAGGIVWFFSSNSKATDDDTGPQKRRIVEPENVIPVSERPVLSIKPEADGRNVTITVSEVKKAATETEYLLEYQTGTLVQAQQGMIQLASLPVSEKILLGSCSAGGACTYHTDIKGGSLKTRFAGDSEAYALKSDWKYIENTDKDSSFSSRDAFFQIEAEELATARYLIIFNGSGYPEGLTEFGEPVSDPYQLETSTAVSGEATLTLRAKEEGELKVLSWDGKTWTEHEGSVEGKMITATVPLAQLYIAVK